MMSHYNKKVFWCIWSQVQSVWYCTVCERVVFSICRHTQQVHAQIGKRDSSFPNTCLYRKIKENGMGGRPKHSKQKSFVPQWAGISRDTSIRELAVIRYVPDYHIAVIFSIMKQRSNFLRGCKEVYTLLGEPMHFFISRRVLLKCLSTRWCVLTVLDRSTSSSPELS